jgi:hypothetical protein
MMTMMHTAAEVSPLQNSWMGLLAQETAAWQQHLMDQAMEATLSLNSSYEGWARSKLNQRKLTTLSNIFCLMFRQVLPLFKNDNLQFLVHIVFISTS